MDQRTQRSETTRLGDDETERFHQLTYQTSGYKHPRVTKKLLNLDIDIGTGTTFSKDLVEDFVIDTLSDIYLDSILTFKTKKNSTGHANPLPTSISFQPDHFFYLLEIDQLPITTHTNFMNHKIVIANQTTDNNATVVQKSQKYNHIGHIHPTTLTTISGSLTNIFHEAVGHHTDSRIIVDLLFVSRD